MLTRSPRSRPKSKAPAPSRRAVAAKRRASSSSGEGLPEWNLTDLYSAIDAPEVRRDLDRARSEAVAFEAAYKGKLAELVRRPDGGGLLAEAIRRLEALDDLIGRLMSFASLVHAGDTTDPTRTKFFGDVQDEITAISLHLLFFTLELNRIDDDLLEAAMADPGLRHYRPFVDVVRLEKPYQLEDRVEQLFHEKSITGFSAWNRLFDETIAGLRFKVAGKTLPLEPTLNLMQDKDERIRKAAAGALAETLKKSPHFHAHHQYARQG